MGYKREDDGMMTEPTISKSLSTVSLILSLFGRPAKDPWTDFARLSNTLAADNVGVPGVFCSGAGG
jgi:hypothetical protein